MIKTSISGNPLTHASRAAAAALLAVGLTLGATDRAEARRIFVPRHVKTIQGAVDEAQRGDTVWVSSGVYSGTIVVKKSITLFGDGGPTNTILDGGDSLRVLQIEGVKGVSVIGFQIRNGRAAAGGGIHCAQDTSVTIMGCLFRNNTEGALALWSCFDVNLNELEFLENQGGALIAERSSLVLRNMSFDKNTGYAGGAMSLTQSRISLPMRNIQFLDNRATGATGGAIFTDSSAVNIGECLFKRNSAAVAGGAIAVMNGSKVNVSRCRFDENNSKASGAIHVDGSQFNLGGSIFVRNRAIAFGASVGLVGRALANVNPIILTSTFYRDSTEGDGGSLFCENVSPEVRRNIFSLAPGQQAVAGVGYSPLYECNLIHDPTGAALASLPSVETLVGDPLFCDPDGGNFFVRDLSPAVLAKCGPIGALPKGCSSFEVVPSRLPVR